jgi:hypothetical protein
MKPLLFAISLMLLSVMGVQSQDVSNGYRGIVPLISTRGDVERLFGRPTDEDGRTYHFSDTTVEFQYSKYGCTPPPQIDGWPAPPVEGWNIPADRVLAVRVTLRKPVFLNSLKVDLHGFTKERGDSDVPSHFRYVNREKGMTIDLNGDPDTETVQAFIYEPEAKYNSLRCSKAQPD